MSLGDRADLPASISRRLLNLSRENDEEYQLTLVRYAGERLLYRLSRSKHARRFILKGATLFAVWTGRPYRPTRDIDLLGLSGSTRDLLVHTFREICRIAVQPDDGLVFDPDEVRVEEIRQQQEYGGLRVRLAASLGRIRIPLQIDVGYGDAVTPAAQEIVLPVLLDHPAPKLFAYPPETLIAEKLQAITSLGIANSRMKDFHDLLLMSRRFAFEGGILAEALLNTFKRRRTELPVSVPLGLSDEFARNEEKNGQWIAFLRRTGLELNESNRLTAVLVSLRRFLLPPLYAAAEGKEFDLRWEESTGWR